MVRRQSWKPSEHQALAAWYPVISAKKLQQLLPERTPKAIRQEAFDLGLKKCHERLRELGRENVRKRWDKAVFRTPEPPPQ